MATIDQIKPDGPVILDPAQHDLDHAGVVVGLDGTESITLKGSEASAFLCWAVTGHSGASFLEAV